MIIYDLRCEREHRFEGWFKNGEEFDDQQTAGLLVCPVCGSCEVRKVPSASYIAKRGGPSRSGDELAGLAAQSREMMSRLHEFVERHYEDVGGAFTEEAKRIHYGEATERPIRGQANAEQVRELQDEGVAVSALPAKPEDKEKLN